MAKENTGKITSFIEDHDQLVSEFNEEVVKKSVDAKKARSMNTKIDHETKRLHTTLVKKLSSSVAEFSSQQVLIRLQRRIRRQVFLLAIACGIPIYPTFTIISSFISHSPIPPKTSHDYPVSKKPASSSSSSPFSKPFIGLKSANLPQSPKSGAKLPQSPKSGPFEPASNPDEYDAEPTSFLQVEALIPILKDLQDPDSQTKGKVAFGAGVAGFAGGTASTLLIQNNPDLLYSIAFWLGIALIVIALLIGLVLMGDSANEGRDACTQCCSGWHWCPIIMGLFFGFVLGILITMFALWISSPDISPYIWKNLKDILIVIVLVMILLCVVITVGLSLCRVISCFMGGSDPVEESAEVDAAPQITSSVQDNAEQRPLATGDRLCGGLPEICGCITRSFCSS